MVVDDTGAVLADADAEQPLSVPRPGWAEQDPELWWTSTRQAVAAAMTGVSRLPRSVEVGAVGLSGQMHSSVFLDESCEVIRPALLWADTRTTEQCREITETLGLDGLRRTVGNRALEGFTAPKVLWLRQHEPDSYERLRRLLLPKDYIRYRLTGELATEPSDAAGTLLFDVRERQWSTEALDALEIDGDMLPEVVGSAEVSGRVSVGAAERLGLQVGLPVVGGGADNAAGAVGSGVVGPGTVQSSIGTSGTMLLPAASPMVDGEMRLHTFCHCVPDRWYLMGVILSAGNAMRWLRDVLLEGGSYETLTAEAEQVPPGSDGLYFLPYLTGERTPHNDSAARGVFFGLAPGPHEGAHGAGRDGGRLLRAPRLAGADASVCGGCRADQGDRRRRAKPVCGGRCRRTSSARRWRAWAKAAGRPTARRRWRRSARECSTPWRRRLGCGCRRRPSRTRTWRGRESTTSSTMSGARSTPASGRASPPRRRWPSAWADGGRG